MMRWLDEPAVDAAEISELVRSQIGDAWDARNGHDVDLRSALVPPRLVSVIERVARDGGTQDRVIEVWLVLVERPDGDGYRIVAAKDGGSFGLASEGFAKDEHLVLSGWYGDFMTAFLGM